ncbi:MAG: hypothetical protein IKW74_02745, partial [Thermoguttaceae bacterium]|nr:hypothetical protein [Thermoguttaceae bacterium]
REIIRAWKSGYSFIEIYVDSDFLETREPDSGFNTRHTGERQWFLCQVAEKRIPVFAVLPHLFKKIGFGERNEGIIALVQAENNTLEALEQRLPQNPLLGVLEGVEKPGNTGAVFRSADGAGLDGLIIATPNLDLYNPNIIRASLGTVFHLPTAIAPAAEVVKWLKQKKIAVAAAICDRNRTRNYTEFDYTQPTAIVLGNEADGLTSLWSDSPFLNQNDEAILIPMLGIADSLNISNAAAILFYEARRRRMEKNIPKTEF